MSTRSCSEPSSVRLICTYILLVTVVAISAIMVIQLSRPAKINAIPTNPTYTISLLNGPTYSNVKDYYVERYHSGIVLTFVTDQNVEMKYYSYSFSVQEVNNSPKQVAEDNKTHSD